jgi:hypothetical protein
MVAVWPRIVRSRPVSEHSVSRPAWTCDTCQQDWPCEPAQKTVADLHVDDHESLVEQMSRLMIWAADDLGLADPAKLYKRFLRWTLPKDHACRLCGKPGHDAVPGVPPRLIPCDEQAVEPFRVPKKAR